MNGTQRRGGGAAGGERRGREDRRGQNAADKDKTGYPQLTEEAIIEADPQLIVITDQSGYTAADVAKRPGWESVSAVKNDNIVTVDADVASRWGPRLPELISALVEAMNSAAVPAS